MANQNFSTDLQQEVTCPICLDILQDPVTIGCGHNFCHVCITKHMDASREFFKCPLCNSSMKNDAYAPNWQLENLAKKIESLDPSEMQPREEQQRCPTHGKVIQYYCKADGELLCVVCLDSKEHKFHKTSTVEEAAQHHQEQIWRHLEVLEQKEKELLHSKIQGEDKITNFMDLVESEEQRIHTEFKHHQEILEVEKNLSLSYIKWLEKEGNRECKCYIIATRAQLSLLKDLKDFLKAKQQMQPVELLQNIKGTMHRCEAMQFQFHSLPVIPLELETKVSKAKSRHDSIIKSLWKFGGAEKAFDKIQHYFMLKRLNKTQVEFEKQQIHKELRHPQRILEEENFLLSYIKWLEEEGAKACEHYNAATLAQLSLLKDLVDALKT
ncbi:E3 ubiquitin-protein ligase TRIM31-like [Ochotona curzoniae]|uniref:E3 ubiquitin-protein ligase TRIM31-like n=1 Tax=Ochotona curzoniae TaxID=130825 RepID=UPI001B34B778|nr:E3 ubiquitin-protein ligase TRIM31-like [Ochotona curzoniae]